MGGEGMLRIAAVFEPKDERHFRAEIPVLVRRQDIEVSVTIEVRNMDRFALLGGQAASDNSTLRK
jgi:hypothetical protein